MLNVRAFTAGWDTPSARFRIRQLIPSLRDRGISVHEDYKRQYCTIRSFPGHRLISATIEMARRSWVLGHQRPFNVAIVQKPFHAKALTIERLWQKPLIFDVDDAVHLVSAAGGAARRLAEIAELVVVGNEELANWYSAHAQRVEIIPTAVDIARYRPRDAAPTASAETIIGWVGTAPNVRQLERIEGALRAVFQEVPNARLLVVSNKMPRFGTVVAKQTKYVEWCRESEVSAIQAMDIGIMPLRDGPRERGKCAYKMLQYMACGKPVVVSPVGMNRSILESGDVGLAAKSEDEWVAALKSLCADAGQRYEMGRRGRQIVEARFPIERIARRWDRVLRSVIRGD